MSEVNHKVTIGLRMLEYQHRMLKAVVALEGGTISSHVQTAVNKYLLEEVSVDVYSQAKRIVEGSDDV